MDGYLGVVEAHFPWGVFVLVCPCAVEGVQDRGQVWGGGRAGFFTADHMPPSVVPEASSIWLRYVGARHGGCDSFKPLAVVPNFNCGIAVVEAMELVGFLPRLPGKSLRELPSGKAVITNNIIVPPVGKDALSVGGTQYIPSFPSACCGVVQDTGAERLLQNSSVIAICLSWSSFERWKWWKSVECG